MTEVEVKHCNGGSLPGSVSDRDDFNPCGENGDGENFTDDDFDESEDETLLHNITPHETVNQHRFQSRDGVNRALNICVSAVVRNGSKESSDYCDLYHHERKDQSDSLESIERDSGIVGILGKDKYEGEARLAARRQARAEAREIRMRELERQQREQEENADKAYDMHAEPLLRAGARGGVGRLLSPAALHSSRRSSEDSLEDSKDVRFELKELEDKFRKTMILNAQLDNDKSSLTYQLEVIKDKLEELQEQHAQLQRLNREKCSALEISRREGAAARLEAERSQAAILARDQAANDGGLVLVALPPDEQHLEARLAYVSKESEKMLEGAGEGSLDVRLQKMNSEKQALEEEVKNLRLQLNSEHSRKRLKSRQYDGQNGPTEDCSASDSDESGGGKDARRLANEYLYRACRAEQEAAALGAATARLEAQVARHKATAERAEQAEDELKAERRRLQREAREALSRVEELETENSHLTKRLDKLKNAKSALLKEL